MKEASERLEIARRCENLAGQANEASSTRMLQVVASQWRKLATDTERHKRLTWTRRPEGDGPTSPGLAVNCRWVFD